MRRWLVPILVLLASTVWAAPWPGERWPDVGGGGGVPGIGEVYVYRVGPTNTFVPLTSLDGSCWRDGLSAVACGANNIATIGFQLPDGDYTLSRIVCNYDTTTFPWDAGDSFTVTLNKYNEGTAYTGATAIGSITIVPADITASTVVLVSETSPAADFTVTQDYFAVVNSAVDGLPNDNLVIQCSFFIQTQ